LEVAAFLSFCRLLPQAKGRLHHLPTRPRERIWPSGTNNISSSNKWWRGQLRQSGNSLPLAPTAP
jgi:hypothetical protein